jgi:hypothetical protein
MLHVRRERGPPLKHECIFADQGLSGWRNPKKQAFWSPTCVLEEELHLV